MSIGNNIKKIRLEKNIKQKELAQMLNVSASMIAQYESGERNPKRETVEKIADALEVDPFSLYSFDMATAVLNDSITQKEEALIRNYRLLNGKGQEKAIEQVEMLTKIPEYQKED